MNTFILATIFITKTLQVAGKARWTQYQAWRQVSLTHEAQHSVAAVGLRDGRSVGQILRRLESERRELSFA